MCGVMQTVGTRRSAPVTYTIRINDTQIPSPPGLLHVCMCGVMQTGVYRDVAPRDCALPVHEAPGTRYMMFCLHYIFAGAHKAIPPIHIIGHQHVIMLLLTAILLCSSWLQPSGRRNNPEQDVCQKEGQKKQETLQQMKMKRQKLMVQGTKTS